MRPLSRSAVALALTLTVVGCRGEPADAPSTVDIIAEDYEFTALDSLPSGWLTLRMHNHGSEHHLFTFVRLPDGVTYEDFETEVLTAYDSVWTLVLEGTIDRSEVGEMLRPLLPDWHSEMVQPGGVSLTAPGRVAQTTLRLDPGLYVMECDALTSENEYHLLRGMVTRVAVGPSSTDAEPPEADYALTVSNLDLEGAGPVSSGEQTFAVHFETDPEEVPWQHVHLARLDEETGADELAAWMKVDPVMPAPVEFLGGAQHMPAGNTSYVTVELEPGRYAWILGVPPELSEVEPFTVE